MSAEIQRAVVELIRRGAAPIPVPAGEKNPGRRGWEALRISEEEVPQYWTNGQNVGLLCGEPSQWRVDVDLDADEAVKIAGRFLPPTLTSGRESRPHSHWWYVAQDVESCDWKDIGGKKLVELRSTGRQTIVAPSTHPEGDRYLWHTEGGLEMAEIPAPELRERCRELTTAALIARHVPPEGSRHDCAMAAAGLLLRPGRLDKGLTLKILKAAWHAAGADTREALRDLEGVVSDTAENLEAGEPVVGGPTLEEYAPGIVNLLYKWWDWKPGGHSEQDPADEKEERRNQADRLIGYALENLGDDKLFADQHGAPHALIGGNAVSLDSRCYGWLRRLMWEREGRAVNGEYLKTAAGTLAAHAEFSGEARELHTRAAWREGVLYYELRPGKVVRVGAGGWTFDANPPVLFRRYPNLKPLPDPEAGGSLEDVCSLVNLKTERDRRLFTTYAATVALPHVGRPILNASGPMGAGKTTAGRVVKRLFDPTAPETVRYDPRDFLQKAQHAYIPMLDNVSALPDSAADTLCRLVTGEADSKRKLYTDEEDVIIELRRAVILNGINVPTDRGDVLDRSLVVELERIPDKNRRTEEDLWERFEAEHPKLLGAAFDVLSRSIVCKPSLQLSRRPRLADWGEYAASVYEVLGWGAETFLTDWDEIVRVQNRSALDGSPVAQAVIKFMEDRESFEGSSTELHKKLESVAEEIGVSVTRDKAWPKSARWLWRRMQEVVPLLVAAGIEAERGRDENAKQIILRKLSADDGSDGRKDKPRLDTDRSPADTKADDGMSNGREVSNGRNDGIQNPAGSAGSANTADTANRYGNFSGPVSFDAKPGEAATVAELRARRENGNGTPSEYVRKLFKNPPDWLRNQAGVCREQGAPERLLKPLAVAVATHLYEDHARAAEIMPAVAAQFHPLGCECGECV